MKKIFYLLSLIPVLALGQSTDQNYVKSTTYKVATITPNPTPDADEAVVQITYFDGLGRPIQQIAHKQSNTGKDIVTHIEYDQFGRQTREYLPFVSTGASLNYLPSAQTDLLSFYASPNPANTGNPHFEATGNPFSEKQLESSPLNRVFKQAAPGDAWGLPQTTGLPNDRSIKFDYQTNDSSDGVKLYKAVANWNSTNKVYDFSINDLGTYANNQLYKTITKDENWTSGNNNTSEEFKDKEGRVVLKRTYNSGDRHDTYYIYDQYGNLTAVLSPLAEGSASQINLDELGYQYKYDSRNRLVEKKLPGKQWEFIVYDKLDRPIATGPAYTPYGGEEIGWMITEYDVFGRVTQTGWIKTPVSEIERTNNQEIVISGTNPFTLGTDDILTKNYYDNYDYPDAPQLPSDVEGQTLASNVRGLPTGSWVKVLDANNPLAYEASYTLYDNRFRSVRSYTKNHQGGFTQVDSKLDWAGKTLYTVTTHARNQNSTPIVITDTFEYTQQDRLQTHKQQINQLDEQLISANTYDELGQLISKNVGGDFLSLSALQKVDYTYNIRGWLKTINDISDITTENDLFAFKINYNNPSNVQALFNGNISETHWKTANDNILRGYFYDYDHLNRLNQANYYRDGSNYRDSYHESMNYDKNGNILSLLRHGDSDANDYVFVIDDLTYTYNSQSKNQLTKVADNTNSPQGFKDGTNSDDDYEYDAMGNLIFDANKGIQEIVYNHLNLPTSVKFANDGSITYLYNALGVKLRKEVSLEGNPVTEYMVGGFQYFNQKIKHFPHAEGYVDVIEDTYNYVFHYTDHLGNIRLSYSDANKDNFIDGNEILEENNYYPFGLKHTAYNTNEQQYVSDEELNEIILELLPKYEGDGSYQYKFQEQERQDELGLNWDSFKWRNYDYAIGRFMNVDPLAEQAPDKTPYHFVSNNPINRIDPDGRWDIQVHAYNNRSKSGYAVMIMRDNSGNEVYRTVVKTVGFGGRKRNVSMSDTPQGNYKILGWRKTGSGTRYNTTTYGPNDLLALDYQGGEGGSRNGMHVHGGRQEGKYKGRKNLMETGGCFRINDSDIKEMQNIATNLQNSNPDEKPGVLKLTDDLINPVEYNDERHNAGTSQFPKNSTTTENQSMSLQEELDWINSVKAFDPKYVEKRSQEIRNEMRKQDNN